MTTNLQQPRSLPASAIPDGCLPWDGEQARRWIGALPPRWVPVRLRSAVVVAAVLGAGALAGVLALPGGVGLRGWVAACVALQLVWVVVRPEVVPVAAPALVVVVLTQGDGPAWAVRSAVVAGLAVLWVAAVLRLVARRRQREAARAAAGGVSGALPDDGAPLRRGKFLAWVGAVTLVVGAVLVVGPGGWELLDDRQAGPAVGWFVAGIGVTVLLSAALGRGRAAGLRREPVPVLRVLMRVNKDIDTEVYAADDLEAVRPLFTVATSVLDEDEDEGDGEGEKESDGEDDEGEDEGEKGSEGEDDEGEGEKGSEGEDDEGEDDDEEMRELLDRLDADQAGPLREAVLYGVPYDGAEVQLLVAADELDESPVVERSSGPVRPLAEGAVRRRIAGEKRAVADEARRREAVEDLAGRLRGQGAVEVRRWRAGWPDWLTVALGVAWVLVLFVSESGLWRYVLGALLGLAVAVMVPRRLAWRVTADREGLWFNGLGGTRQLAWDDVRAVECKGVELKVGSRGSLFDEWSVGTLRWRPLERKLGLVHPYDRIATEITAMWQDPAARPAEVSDERQRGRALWPLAVLVGLGWVAVVVWG